VLYDYIDIKYTVVSLCNVIYRMNWTRRDAHVTGHTSLDHRISLPLEMYAYTLIASIGWHNKTDPLTTAR